MKQRRLTVLVLVLCLVVATILAACGSTEYTVTFRDGTTDVSTVKVADGEALTAEQIPQAPIGHNGMDFGGWYVGDTKVEAGYKPDSDVVATAKWTQKATKHTVTFRDGTTDIATVEVADGEALTAEQIPQAPSGHDGFSFDGWFVGTVKVEAGYKPDSDVVATARFSDNTPRYAKLTLNAGNGGSIDVTSYDVQVGTSLLQFLSDKLPTPQEKLSFNGWYNGRSKIGERDTMPNTDLTLTAKYDAAYKVKRYFADVNDDYSEEFETATGKAIFGEPFTYTENAPVHYVLDDNAEGFVATTDSLGKEDVFCIYYLRATVTVHYDVNIDGVDASIPSDGNYVWGEKVPLADGNNFDVPSNYRFVGWASQPDGELEYSARDQFDTTPLENDSVTLYAVWELGLSDFFFGDDWLFISSVNPNTVYLRRIGLPEKTGTYNPETYEFAFKEGDNTVLEGLAYGGKFYYYEDLSGKTFVNALDETETLKFDGKSQLTYSYTPKDADAPVTVSGTYRMDYLTGEYIFTSQDIQFHFTASVRNDADGPKYLFYKATDSVHGFFRYVSGNSTSVLYLDGMLDENEVGGAVGYSVTNGKLTAVYKAYYYLLSEEEYGFATPTYRVMDNNGDEMFLVRVTQNASEGTIDGQTLAGSFRTSDGYDGAYYSDIMDEDSLDLWLDGFGKGKYITYEIDQSGNKTNVQTIEGNYTIGQESFLVDSDNYGVYEWSEEWIRFVPTNNPEPICFGVAQWYWYLLFERMEAEPRMEEWSNSAKKVYGDYVDDNAVFYYSADGSVYVLSYTYNQQLGKNVYYEVDVGYVSRVEGQSGLFVFESGFYTDANSFFQFRYNRGKVETTVAGATNFEIKQDDKTLISVDKWGTLTYDGETYEFGEWSRSFVYEYDNAYRIEVYSFDNKTATVLTALEENEDGYFEETGHTLLDNDQLLPLVRRLYVGQQDEFDNIYFIDETHAAIAVRSNDGSLVLLFHGTYAANPNSNTYTFTLTPSDKYAEAMDESVLETYLEVYGSFVYKLDKFEGVDSAIVATYSGNTEFYNTNGDLLELLDNFGSACYTPVDGEEIFGTYEKLDANGYLLRFVSDGIEYFFRLSGENFSLVESDDVGVHYIAIDGMVYVSDYIVFFGDATEETAGTTYYGGQYGKYRLTGKTVNYWMMSTANGLLWVEYEVTVGGETFRVICGDIEMMSGEILSVYVDEMPLQKGLFTDDAGGRIEADGYNVVYYAQSGFTFYGEFGIGFVNDKSPLREDYRWDDDFEKGEQLIFKSEYLVYGGEVFAVNDYFLFDIDETDRDRLVVRDQYNGTYALYDRGTVSNELLYLDGHGNATRIDAEGRELFAGKYSYSEELDRMLFDGGDGVEDFTFTLAEYTFLRDVYLIFYVSGENRVYVNGDWSVLSLGDLREHQFSDGTTGFVNGVYVESDGSAHYGYYNFVADGIVYFEITEVDRLFFNVNESEHTFSLNTDKFITVPVEGGKKLVGYNAPTEITDFELPDDVVEIGNGVFANFMRIGGTYKEEGGNEVLNYKFDLNNVKVIGDYAFYNVHNFGATEIVSENVTHVGNYAFYSEMAVYDQYGNSNHYYNYINTVTLPNATYIGDYAFFGCNQMNLGTTKLNSVEYIGNFAFTHNYFNTGEVMTLDLTEADVTKIDMQRNAFFPGENTTNWETMGWPVRILVKDLDAYFATFGWFEEIQKKVVMPDSGDSEAVVGTAFVCFADGGLLRLEKDASGNFVVNKYVESETSFFGGYSAQKFATYTVDKEGNIYVILSSSQYVRIATTDVTVNIDGTSYCVSGRTQNFKVSENGSQHDFSFDFSVSVEFDDTLKSYEVNINFTKASWDGKEDDEPRYYSYDNETTLTLGYVDDKNSYFETTVDLNNNTATTEERGVLVFSADKVWRAIMLDFNTLAHGYSSADLYKRNDDGSYSAVSNDVLRRNSVNPDDIFYSCTVIKADSQTTYTLRYFAAEAEAEAYITVSETTVNTKTVETDDYKAVFAYDLSNPDVMTELKSLEIKYVSGKSVWYEAINGRMENKSENVFTVTVSLFSGTTLYTVTYKDKTFTVEKEDIRTTWFETQHSDGQNYYEVGLLIDKDGNLIGLGDEIKEYTYSSGSYSSFSVMPYGDVTREGDTFTFSTFSGDTYVITCVKGADGNYTVSVQKS